MLKIRLARAGKRNLPFFRVVLTDHTKPAKSGYKEILGFYNPISKEFKIKDVEKVKKYISTGTQFSPRVEKLMKDNNIAL
ncbi:MAG: 30S ribosomal protein S16 [Candidatus Gracilibacteria bacterium]|nr:30S ribosomal protein S16 [Candidatus Gracilibacteria bacterium]